MNELKPFIKWAGGKRQLMDLIRQNLPKKYNNFFEPFLGGGAVLLNLQPEKATVSDVNPELINAFQVVKHSPDALIKKLLSMKNKEEVFYRVRKQNPQKLENVARAARFIYLNKTCFNGLYRENSKGEFNVPYGRYPKPQIVDEENLLAVHQYLKDKDVTLVNGDYRQILMQAKKGDFIYLDSPYYPLKPTSFTKYSKNNFSEKDHRELAEIFKALDARGCYVLMSNSNTDFIKDLYQDYDIQEINASRSINSNGEGRKKSKIEVLIKNY